MSKDTITKPFIWKLFTNTLHNKCMNLRNKGIFLKENLADKGMHLAVGKEGSIEEESLVEIYLMVDLSDGIVVDAKFQAFGPLPLMASCQIICEQIIGKNYDQAHNFSLTVLLKSFKEPLAKEVIAEFTPYLESVLDAVRKATETCQAIPLPQTYVLPISQENHATGDGYPGFEQLSHEQKIALIEQVIADDIRPYIEMDGGGIQVINLLEDKELIISYEGNCSSCYSAIGTTLAYIQQMIHAKVSPHITVVPDIDPESFSFN